MPDADLRELERRSRAGDADATEALIRVRRRTNPPPDFEEAGFVQVTNLWLCEDAENWTYHALMAHGNLVLRSSSSGREDGAIHLKPGVRLDCLIWLLEEFRATGKFPLKSLPPSSS